MTRERWMELLTAAPPLTGADMIWARTYAPKRTAMNVAIQLAFYGRAVVGFEPNVGRRDALDRTAT
jgi:hypothetical protein